MTGARGSAAAMPPGMVLPPSPVPVDYPRTPSPIPLPVPVDYPTIPFPVGVHIPSPYIILPSIRHGSRRRRRRRSPTPSQSTESAWSSLDSADFGRIRQRHRSRYISEGASAVVPPPKIPPYGPYEFDIELGAYPGI